MEQEIVLETHNRAFGIVMSRLRRSKGWPQEALAFEAGLTRNYISLLERGLRSPTLDSLIKICAALLINLNTLARLLEIEMEAMVVDSQRGL